MPASRLRLRPSFAATSVFAIAVLLGCSTEQQTSSAPPEAAPARTTSPPEIDATRMRNDVEVLAADDYAGRYSLTPEKIERAARYLADAHRKAGLRPVGSDYLVDFDLAYGSEAGDRHHFWLSVDGENVQVDPEDFASLNPGEDEPVVAKVVWLGSLQKVKPAAVQKKVAGRVVFAGIEAPLQAKDVETLSALQTAGAKAFVLLGETAAPDPKVASALSTLPTPVLSMKTSDAAGRLEVEGSPITKAAAGTAFDEIQVSLARARQDILHEVPNVLAVIPGRERPEEIVMVGAHYDHIGTSESGLMCGPPDEGGAPGDQICNGADDNASGTAMVLELARAFAESGFEPTRTLVFAHFAGEELGLHGSAALAKKPPAAPPFDEGKVVAMVNLDMVGRLGDPGLSIGAVSSSPAWMEMLRKYTPADMKVSYERSVTSRSDHASFYRKDIPVLFFFTGLHEDYHRTSDHADKINHDGMADIAKLVSGVLFELAQGAEVPFSPPSAADEGEVTRLPETEARKKTDSSP